MKLQDFDRLSAYIDHQLSPGEQAALEQRLAQEPELRAALAELRLTVKAVRALPMVKPPRNFMLTPAQAGLPAGGRVRRGSLFPTLRLAAALSAVALALVVGGDFAASRGFFGPAALPANDVLFTTTDESASTGAEQGLATATPEAELSVMAATEAPAETLVPEAAPDTGGAGAPEATADIMAAMPAATPSATPGVERQGAATPATDADVTLQAEAESTTSTKVGPPADATALAYAEEAAGADDSVPAPGFPTLRLLEAALAMLTMLLGLGAWFASRNAA
jgi:hypothetical protein